MEFPRPPCIIPSATVTVEEAVFEYCRCDMIDEPLLRSCWVRSKCKLTVQI